MKYDYNRGGRGVGYVEVCGGMWGYVEVLGYGEGCGGMWRYVEGWGYGEGCGGMGRGINLSHI